MLIGDIKPADKLFESHRKQLQAVGYRMLGSISEAEDVVQDGYIRWNRHWRKQNRDCIETPRAFLTSLVTRLCLDRLRRRKLERHNYLGPWLPEPMPTELEEDPADQIAVLQSINTAFVLPIHGSFYTEPDEHWARKPWIVPSGKEAEPLVESFYLAASLGDMKSLTQLLC